MTEPGSVERDTHSLHVLGKQWMEPSCSGQTGARQEVIWGQPMTNRDRLRRVGPEKT